MNQIITLSLGMDRLYAVMSPFSYRFKNHLKIAQGVVAFSFVLGFVDAGTYLLQQYESSTCNSLYATYRSGFSIQTFRIFSNLIINLITLIVHLIMYWKLREMKIETIFAESKEHFRQVLSDIILKIYFILFHYFPIFNIIIFSHLSFDRSGEFKGQECLIIFSFFVLCE